MLKKTKTSLIVRGVLFTLLGVLCLCNPKATLESFAWIVGAILIAGGIATFLLGRRKGSSDIAPMHLVAAVLMVVIGLLIVIRPQVIAVLLGVFILFEGVDFSLRAFRYRKAGAPRWWLLLLIGLLVVVFGAWAVGSPWVGAAMLSVIVGIGCLGIGIDSFVALIGLGRVDRFFSEAKDALRAHAEGDSETFVEAEVVD